MSRLSTQETSFSKPSAVPIDQSTGSGDGNSMESGILPPPVTESLAPSTLHSGMHGFEFWEIFAGCAKLSSCLQTEGFTVFPVDHDEMDHVPLVPVFFADLREPAAQKQLIERIHTMPPIGIHLAMPCGTGSRAREQPISAAKRKLGVPQPPPLRSAEHPMGIPNLKPFHQAKIDSSNELLRFVVELLFLAFQKGVHVVLENPERSWIWAALVFLVLQKNNQTFSSWYNGLHEVIFDACEHGGSRPKSTKLATTLKVLLKLARRCGKNHVHSEFGTSWNGSRWVFDTSLEAEYPLILCQRYARLVSKFFKLPPLPQHSHRALHIAASQRQHKASRPLIPEYRQVQLLKKDQSDPTTEFKILESLTSTGEDDRDRDGARRVGIYHTKLEFFNKALAAKHPCNTNESVTPLTKEVVSEVLEKGFTEVASQRIKAMVMIKKLKTELATEELRFKSTLPEHCRKVLASKSVLLWKKLLEITKFPDRGVFELMCGTPLAGEHSKSEIFGERIVMAKTSEQLLRLSSVWRNPTLLARKVHEDDPALQKVLWNETLKEVEKGYIQGPYSSLEDVRRELGSDSVCLVRRFAILQGQGEDVKPRVIDDAKESGLNAAYTAKEKMDLHDFDHVSSIASYIGSRLLETNSREGRLHAEMRTNMNWLGRCLDLSKAYKQIPISTSSRSLMVLMVPNPATGKQMFFTTSSMPFGCAASVFSFNRITRSLLHIMQVMLRVVGGVFYDDFALLEPAPSAKMCGLSVEGLLDALGWIYAKEGDKATEFEGVFNLLGAQLDLRCLHLGRIVVSNKPGRIDKMVNILQDVKRKGCISKAEAQSFHGLLNYASGFFLGSACKTAARCFSNLISNPGRASSKEISGLCDFTISCLSQACPREWECQVESNCLVVFTDGSFEKGVGLWGAVVIDDISARREVFWGSVPQRLIDGWIAQAGEQIISQIEAFAALLVRWCFRSEWMGRKALFFIDNDAARYALIKSSSGSSSLLLVTDCFHSFDAEFPLMTWVERVASSSNIADLPSRGQQEEAAAMIKGSLRGDILLEEKILERLVLHPSIPLSLLRAS